MHIARRSTSHLFQSRLRPKTAQEPDIVTILSLHGLTERERLACALRSTDEHLFMDGGRITVCGPDSEGNLRELGSVDPYASLQVGAPSVRQMIEHVKFSNPRKPKG